MAKRLSKPFVWAVVRSEDGEPVAWCGTKRTASDTKVSLTLTKDEKHHIEKYEAASCVASKRFARIGSMEASIKRERGVRLSMQQMLTEVLNLYRPINPPEINEIANQFGIDHNERISRL